MSRKPRESDLRHDAADEQFGAAIVRCEGFAPDCSHYGKCANGGECFASPPNLVAARAIEKIIPADDRGGMHIAYLKKCAEMLRHDRVVL